MKRERIRRGCVCVFVCKCVCVCMYICLCAEGRTKVDERTKRDAVAKPAGGSINRSVLIITYPLIKRAIDSSIVPLHRDSPLSLRRSIY